MSTAAAPSPPGKAPPRLGWVQLALLAAAVVTWGGAVSTERESVQTAAAARQAALAASAAAIASGRALDAHQKVELDMIDARYEHPATLARLAPLEARLKREQDATLRMLVEISGREDALMYSRRFALERRRDDLVAWAAMFAAAALATGVASVRPWPVRYVGYVLAAGVIAWGVAASAARMWDKIG